MNKCHISFYPMWWLINNKKMWQYPAATVVNLPYPFIYTYDAMDSPPTPTPFTLSRFVEKLSTIVPCHTIEIRTIMKPINAEKIITVHYTTHAVAKRKPEEIQACRDPNPNLCDTGAAL